MLSANLGQFAKQPKWAHQNLSGGTVDFYRWTDANFPPRTKALAPRLQAKIPKMFGWAMAPDYDLYLWLDGTFTVWTFRSAQWFVDHLGDADFAAFEHTMRHSIREEAQYLRDQMERGNQYLLSRYQGEDIDAQLAAIPVDYPDDRLFAGGAFIYRDLPNVRQALTEWWVHTSIYHVIDQLALPYVLWKHKVNVSVLPGYFYDGPKLFRPKAEVSE